MSVQIITKIDDKELKAVLKKLEQKGKDLRPALKRSGVYMERSIDTTIKTGGRPKRYKPLATNTIVKKRGKRKPLMDSGRLRLSSIARSGEGNIYRLSKSSLKMGSSLVYASLHQKGMSPRVITPRRKKVLKFMTSDGAMYRPRVDHPGFPARPFILFQKQDVEEIKNIFSSFLVD